MPNKPTSIDTFLLEKKKDQKKYNSGVVERDLSGAFQSMCIEAVPEYNIAENEKLYPGKTNAAIIVGKDRPGNKATGWGSEANKTGAARIDLIAGLNGPVAKETDETGIRLLVDPDPVLDSARIYMTQQAKDIDSDEYFSIVQGKVGYVENESAIAIKADSVRMIGRRGIKIVTGGSKYSGGAGFFIGGDIQGIDLIAGNDDSDLQPMVKGDDLRKLLLRQDELRDELYGFIWFIFKFQLKHLGITMPNPATASLIPAIIKLVDIEGVQFLTDLAAYKLKSILHKLNYDERNPFAFYDFRSKYNHVN